VHLLCAAHEQTMGEHGTRVAMVCGDVLEVEQLAAIDAGESGLDAVETEDRCHACDVGGGGGGGLSLFRSSARARDSARRMTTFRPYTIYHKIRLY
jgi:hypothetical protein